MRKLRACFIKVV